jgi:hypothetical protein
MKLFLGRICRHNRIFHLWPYGFFSGVQVDELLRHFWSLLPVNTQAKQDKLERIQVSSLNQACLRSYALCAIVPDGLTSKPEVQMCLIFVLGRKRQLACIVICLPATLPAFAAESTC